MKTQKKILIIGLILGFAIGFYCIHQYNNNALNIYNTKNATLFKHDGKIHIVIDAGHGGPDPGARNIKLNVLEKNITRKIVDAMVSMVDTSKYTVLQTRPNDSNIHRHQRIDLATKFKTNLLLSFHCNAFTGGCLNGFEIHISDSCLNPKDSTSKPNPYKQINLGIADTLSKNIAYVFPEMKKGGIYSRKDRIWMIYAATFPSILIEWGYINNKKDIEIMQDPVAHQVLAKAVWHSINQHFGFVK